MAGEGGVVMSNVQIAHMAEDGRMHGLEEHLRGNEC